MGTRSVRAALLLGRRLLVTGREELSQHVYQLGNSGSIRRNSLQ